MSWLQVALDLFGAGDSHATHKDTLAQRPDAHSPSAPVVPRKPLRLRKPAPLGPRGTPIWQLPVLSDRDLATRPHEPITQEVRSLPPVPVPNLLVHGQATHRIELSTQDTGMIAVAYRLERAKRRSIGFLINEEGLSVKAPRWVGLPEINQALQQKAPWILRKLGEVQARSEHALSQRIVWADGAHLDFLGEPVTIVLDPFHQSQSVHTQLLPPDTPTTHTRRLLLHVPHGAGAHQIRDAAKAWLLGQAKQLFTERLNHFAPQLGVRWTRLTLSNAGTRWGSAKADGSIRLHWRLIHFRPSIIDYVVVHELSHLRVMDHSPRFWETVATLVPDYADKRKHLRSQHLPKWE